ncbi:hypothetical protein A464_298 [Salmonella bongori N268-08]|uniref:Uncharacterized protein n=1 Tax=Salmonella bongori N268-08 TaxID=1197719 RepID=S5MS70_SALBN|nr:hypothetical protein A464_298 [Salmonella bongori N268-08]
MDQEQLTILHSLKLLFSLAEQQTPLNLNCMQIPVLHKA